MANNFVFDTNSLVSAFIIKSSVPRKALEVAFKEGKLLVSDATLEELNEVLFRSKFDKYLSFETRWKLLNDYVNAAALITITNSVKICRDKKDNKFLELALDGNAKYIVSGDNDLLILDTFENIQIISPARFIKVFTK